MNDFWANNKREQKNVFILHEFSKIQAPLQTGQERFVVLSLDVISVVLNQDLQTVYRLSPNCQLRYVRNLKFTEPSLCSNEDPLARNSTLVLDQRQQMLMSLHGY